MFLKSVPGISYSAYKGYLSGEFCPGGGLARGFCPGGLRHDTHFPI